MTWSVPNRLALIGALVFFGAAAGCGDNFPKGYGLTGAGGGGGGGMTGDGGIDADASPTDTNSDVNAGDVKPDGNADTHEAGGGNDGAAGTDGGAGTGGAAGTDGGAGTSGAAGTDGGAGTGGAAGTGTAGTTGTGTAGTGGAAGTAPDAGTDVPVTPACYSVTFTKPVDNAQLSAADDKDADLCADGFQYDVVISTTAPDGTGVQLYGGTALLQTANASGGTVTFSNVQLASSAITNLSIQFVGAMPCTAASTKAKVTVDCSVPTCTISKPIISATHPSLNGVSTTLGGDRVSAPGSPYEVGFEVTTNIADNQTVALDIDNVLTSSSVSTVTAHAAGGKATFTGVPLPADGKYEVVARCTASTGVVGHSAKGTYPVDTLAPDLVVSKPTSGAFIGPGGITNGTFPVCGSTTATDAVGLDASLGTRQANFCVSTTGSPTCLPATAVGVDTCVNVACPGDAPFSITVTISDAAGNPQTTVLSGVTCSSSTPTVQIVTPVTDAPTFTDPTRHLLAATATQPFRDQTAAVAGAQTDVIACTSRAGTAVLMGGHTGDASLVQIGAGVTVTAASSTDGCPSGLGFVAKFVGVTLPESVETATGALATATELRVDVTDVSASTGKSAPLDLWVDSVAPTIALSSPANFCGSFHQAFATYDTDIKFSTDTPNVTATIVNGSITDTLTSPTFAAGSATFSAVSFAVGQNNLAAVATDAAGNATAMQPPSCPITVGMAPVVLFTAPTSSNVLCASAGTAANCIDDADPLSTGWQGSLTVHALLGGVPLTTGNITFSVSNTQLGVVPIDSSGNATLTGVTLFDGDVTITAQTDNIAGNGVGIGQVTVVVDLGAPDAPTNLTASVLDRRQTSFQLAWTAPADVGGGPVAGYQVRYAQVPITSTNFDTVGVTTAVPYTGTPAVAGAVDGIAVQNLYIENDYYFAAKAVDAAGNVSGVVATSTAATAHFNQTVIASPTGTNQEFGIPIDGSGDGNHDGFSDLLVGAANDLHAYLFLGATTIATTPSVTFTGAKSGFGATVRWIGDVDADGFEDVAITDPGNTRILIYKGRAVWPSGLSDTEFDYSVTAGGTYAGTAFGSTIAALGDFDGDGIDDFAVGANGFATNAGHLDIIYGAQPFTNVALPSTTRALGIGPDPALTRSLLGTAIVGLGHFYSGGGTTLVVSAPGVGNATSTSSNEGRLYAFRGRGPGAAITAASADNTLIGPAKSAKIGSVLSNLGPIVNGLPSVGSGNTADVFSATLGGTTGTGYLLSGTSALGPFSSNVVLTQRLGAPTGQIFFGGGFSGKDVSVSLIGGSQPDLVLVGQTNGGIDIVDGADVSTLTSPSNVQAVGRVHVALPAGWTGGARGPGNLLKDINGDSYADFALGDLFDVVPGRVIVFW